MNPNDSRRSTLDGLSAQIAILDENGTNSRSQSIVGARSRRQMVRSRERRGRRQLFQRLRSERGTIAPTKARRREGESEGC